MSATEAQELLPPMSTEGVLGAALLATDGYLDPSQLTFALAEGARDGGAGVFTPTWVTGIESDKPGASSAARPCSRRASGPRIRLCCLTLEDARSVALGNEPVRVGGPIVGRVTSGGYGYTVERSIAYAYLPPEHDPGTAVAVEIFGRWVEGGVAREPLLDRSGDQVQS